MERFLNDLVVIFEEMCGGNGFWIHFPCLFFFACFFCVLMILCDGVRFWMIFQMILECFLCDFQEFWYDFMWRWFWNDFLDLLFVIPDWFLSDYVWWNGFWMISHDFRCFLIDFWMVLMERFLFDFSMLMEWFLNAFLDLLFVISDWFLNDYVWWNGVWMSFRFSMIFDWFWWNVFVCFFNGLGMIDWFCVM